MSITLFIAIFYKINFILLLQSKKTLLIAPSQMSIDFGGDNTAMAEQIFDGADVFAVF